VFSIWWQAIDFLPGWTFPSSKNGYRAGGAMLPGAHRDAKRNQSSRTYMEGDVYHVETECILSEASATQGM